MTKTFLSIVIICICIGIGMWAADSIKEGASAIVAIVAVVLVAGGVGTICILENL